MGIICLNSAWLAVSDKDIHNIILGKSIIRKAFAELNEFDLVIVAMHHPISWLNDSDRGYNLPNLCRGSHFILHGHLHKSELEKSITPNCETQFFGAGTCYDEREQHYSYNIVEIDTRNKSGEIWLRLYSHNHGGFWTEDNISYEGIKGHYQFPLPQKKP